MDDQSTSGSSTEGHLESLTTVSPHSSEGSASQVSGVEKGDQHLDDGGFVPPLEEYIPLGCITWKVISSLAKTADEIKTCEKWIEAEKFLPSIYGPQNVWSALVSLWRHAWIRVFCHSNPETELEVWRIYVLPEDVSRSAIDRNKANLKKSLDLVLLHVDVASSTWAGEAPEHTVCPFDKWATGESYSLFYMFNTLPSPTPSARLVKDRWSRASMNALLDYKTALPGLETELYRYQRRSAAEMLRREVAPELQLDPRLETRSTPDGSGTYFYGSRDGTLLRQARCYDAVRGGILAETMGLGKTLICIALILATKGHCPEAPPQYAEGRLPVRHGVASLAQMAASTASRHSLPWRRYFDELAEREGYSMDECIKMMERFPPKYEIPPVFVRSHRNSTYSSPSEVVQLCSATIIVVPKNLMHQWRTELNKHVYGDTLRLLIMEDKKTPLPLPEELAAYDVILFSRPRFEHENKHAEEFYESPLTKLHWLRIIIDEGHSFSSANTHAGVVAEKIVRAERRWVVSGTPAKDLMGVEVDMATMTNIEDYENTKFARATSLEQRKFYNSYQEESSGAVKSLGALASRFLKAQPWAATGQTYFEAPARWEDHIYRHESSVNKTYTSFSTCLRRTLENLVIKTQPEDVERDINLPPLTHRVVRLEPSFIDKLTANLFVLLFTTNAVTSERRDQDYLFHKNSQHHLHRLIANLRQSAFFWTGMEEEAVRSSLDVTWKYLEKKGTNCSAEDRKLLKETANAANVALTSPLWKSTTQTSDMGVFMDHWPADAVSHWAFSDCEDPAVMSLSLSIDAQHHVNDRLEKENPAEELAEAGTRAKAFRSQFGSNKGNKQQISQMVEVQNDGLDNGRKDEDITRLPAQGASNMTSPQKMIKRSSPKTDKSKTDLHHKPAKRRLDFGDASVELSPNSDLGRTVMRGTTSAKFSYLIDRITALQRSEKILVFYDGGHIAYFLAEALDLLNVKYLLYTNTLSGEQRGKYVVLFDTDPSHRVLIMDIKQAAHGLNLSSASRVFFVNPVCRPNIEAQAIKRAHRIGQTRAVHVETLLLKGSIEEKMHERATKMTNQEHLQAKTLEDDGAMARIIQEARILPLTAAESQGEGQMARLMVPQQIFGRPGRGKGLASKLEVELFGDEAEPRPSKRSRNSKVIKAERGSRTASTGHVGDLMEEHGGSVRQAQEEAVEETMATADPVHSGYTSIFGAS